MKDALLIESRLKRGRLKIESGASIEMWVVSASLKIVHKHLAFNSWRVVITWLK